MLSGVVLLTVAVAAHSPLPPSSVQDTVNVGGEAEIRVVPDEVLLSLGVETFDKVLRVAKTQNDDRIRRTIALARSFAVQPEHIQTDYVGIEPKYDRGDIALMLQGFVVRKTILIRLKDIKKYEDLLAGALEAGVTHVHGVDFRTTDLRKHRDQARVLAMTAAQEKAELLAKETGRKVGRVTSIGEASYGYYSSYGSWWGGRYGNQMSQNVSQNFGGASLETDSTLAPGQISIRASVRANFVLQ
jgi:uncharacterized protein YggE